VIQRLNSKRVLSIALCTFNKLINVFGCDRVQTGVLEVEFHLEINLKLLRTGPTTTSYIDN
jgi:hypothetical protein